MTKDTKRYYYRCESSSEVGKRLRKLLNDCQKAERAQMDYGRKCGAVSIVPVDNAFEGGVIGVLFADDSKVNRTVWKEIVKDKDGKIIWVPNCRHREGAIVAKSDTYRPSDTSTRIYRYQQVGWERVKHLFPEGEPSRRDQEAPNTLRQNRSAPNQQNRSAPNQAPNQQNHEAPKTSRQNHEAPNQAPNQTRYILYTELYRDDTTKPIREMSKQQREAINLERQRIMLPVVTPQRVFATIQADMMAGAKDDERMRIIQPETPTFWEYGSHWYIGCAFPCKAEGLVEISSEAYANKRSDLLHMIRDMEAMAESEGKGN